MAILDSGDRTQYATGAVRDMKEDKGRCDLLPLDVIVEMLDFRTETNFWMCLLKDYQNGKQLKVLYSLLFDFAKTVFGDAETAIIELSKHFQEGAKKYGINNWCKGIPTSSYFDSAVRHLLKWSRGDTDERHDRAFLWNVVCLIWTMENMPEMDDLVPVAPLEKE